MSEGATASIAKGATLDVDAMRAQFPILEQTIDGKPLTYLDNAATSQKPRCVIDAVSHYYENNNANVNRGVHALSMRATTAFDEARLSVKQFINAPSLEEIIFVRGGTEGINLVASSFGQLKIKAGDEVFVSQMEHHANIVPWQLHCERVGARLRVIPMQPDGTLDVDAFEQQLTAKVKLVAVTHVSNVLGTINPVKTLCHLAQAAGIPVLVDGAQAGPHLAIDVQDIACDFYTLSGHKMYGPTGIGVLYAKAEHLKQMPPYQGGGDMIKAVRFEGNIYNDLPYKFEAGTPNIAGAIGLAEAIRFIKRTGVAAMVAHERALLAYALEQLRALPSIRIYGTAPDKAPVIAFTDDVAHAHDIGTILDTEGVAIRTGHHCAMPLMDYYNVPAMARASFAVFNQKADVDRMIQALKKVHQFFSK